MRDHILGEIRRIAAVSGGKVPGRRKFELETGIKEAAWYGVYWARWSDAVREAGLAANEKQGRIADNELLRWLADAVRHFGCFPTQVELRMYFRQTDAAPSGKTFEAHFPTKVAMVEALRTWAEGRPECRDVLALLPPRADDQSPPTASSRSAKADGYVYLIKFGDYYKIGRSDELERRVKEIRVALPDKAELVHVITTDDPPGIEAYWHRRFADRRANGEWFRLMSADLVAFRRRKFQ